MKDATNDFLNRLSKTARNKRKVNPPKVLGEFISEFSIYYTLKPTIDNILEERERLKTRKNEKNKVKELKSLEEI